MWNLKIVHLGDGVLVGVVVSFWFLRTGWVDN